jgi:hypothetical protein
MGQKSGCAMHICLARNALPKVLYGKEHCNDEKCSSCSQKFGVLQWMWYLHAPLLSAGLIVLEKCVYNG